MYCKDELQVCNQNKGENKMKEMKELIRKEIERCLNLKGDFLTNKDVLNEFEKYKSMGESHDISYYIGEFLKSAGYDIAYMGKTKSYFYAVTTEGILLSSNSYCS